MNREERLDDPEESLRLAMASQQAQIWTALPGVVAAVNLAAQTLSVQPTVQGSVASPDGAKQLVNLPLLVDVPIVWPRAGGFALTFPIAAGDEVLVVFASRCIDSWWQSGGIGAPAEARMHDLSDGFAILAPTSQPKKLSGVSSTNVQLRDEAGTTYVEITPDGKARVVAATQIDVEAPTVNITGDLNVTGEMNLVGQLTQSGGSMTIGGVVFGTHKHTGVQPGSGTSGGPTN
ncbi:Gp138 family membrane-puncturing spike protein [Klebsiella pneumoniae]